MHAVLLNFYEGWGSHTVHECLMYMYLDVCGVNERTLPLMETQWYICTLLTFKFYTRLQHACIKMYIPGFGCLGFHKSVITILYRHGNVTNVY